MTLVISGLALGCHPDRDGTKRPADDEDAVASAFTAALEARHPQCKPQASGELRFSVVCGGRRVQVDLHDLHEQLAESSPFEWSQAVDRHLDRFESSLEAENLDRSAVLASVVPLVRSRDVLRGQSYGPERSKGPAIVPYVGDLVIVYALDMPSSIRSLTRATRNELPVEDRELLDRARHNLLDHLPEISRWDGDHVSMITADGQYESSLMLVDELWTDLAAQVDGDLVVAVPSRDVLLFGGTGDPRTVPALREAIETVQSDGGYLVSDHVFRWYGTGWIVLEPQAVAKK